MLGAGLVSGQREGHDGKETSVLEQGREPLRHAFALRLRGRFRQGAQLIQQAIEREQQPRAAREEIVEARAVVQPHLQARRRRVQHAIALRQSEQRGRLWMQAGRRRGGGGGRRGRAAARGGRRGRGRGRGAGRGGARGRRRGGGGAEARGH